MSDVVVLVVAVVLTLVATAGIVPPLRRGDAPPLEPITDRLEDHRVVLRRSLDDLDAANVEGAVDQETYERLSRETRVRLAKVDEALQRRVPGGLDGEGLS